MRRILRSTPLTAAGVATVSGVASNLLYPIALGNPFLELIALKDPAAYQAIAGARALLLFTTPFIVTAAAHGTLANLLPRRARASAAGPLPRYPEIAERRELFVVLAELHHPTEPLPSPTPRWLTISERGLYRGTVALGIPGTGKSAGVVLPFAEQVLGALADDPDRAAAGLILEVKGDCCPLIQAVMEKHGRGGRFIALGLDGEYCYNPLHNDLSPYSLAFQVASLLAALWGKGKEPFWTQAYCDAMGMIVHLHRLLFEYCTLADVYRCMIDHDLLEAKIRIGEELFRCRSFLEVGSDAFGNEKAAARLAEFQWAPAGPGRMRARQSKKLQLVLELRNPPIPYEVVTESDHAEVDADKRHQFEGIRDWFYKDWLGLDPKLRTSIQKGLTVFLGVFRTYPRLNRIFCPPKEAYDPAVNVPDAAGRYKYGKPLPSFAHLIEAGYVVGLNFPVAEDPGLAVTIATLLKMAFERECLLRIPEIARQPGRAWRPVLFAMDEAHMLLSCGPPGDPTGDDKFLSLSRAAKVIPLLASQSVSSIRTALHGDERWRTILQLMATQVFFCTRDELTAKYGAELCGKEDKPYVTYNISESSDDAGVSLLSGRTVARKGSVTTSKSYSLRIEERFRAKVFYMLKNYQAIILPHDGTNPLEATYAYLKPYYLDPNEGWFEQARRGAI